MRLNHLKRFAHSNGLATIDILQAVEMTISSMFGMEQPDKSHEAHLFMSLSTCYGFIFKLMYCLTLLRIQVSTKLRLKEWHGVPGRTGCLLQVVVPMIALSNSGT